VAWHFARGHRGIRVPDPVVATGTINKSNILWATDCRNEHEILGEPRDIKVEDFQLEHLVAYAGWLVVNHVLNDHRHDVSEKIRASVGLAGVHPIVTARAHAIAIKRIGYTPKRVRVGKMMEAPADLLYWRAVLAAVPKAKRQTQAEIEQYEWGQKVMREREEEWVDEDSIYYGDCWGD
jgi:hypothetical protein